MQNRTYESILLKVFLVAIFGLIILSNTYGLERIRWKVQNCCSAPLFKEVVERISEKIKIMSDGKISFRIYKSNSIVPTMETWTAVGEGQLDAGFIMPLYRTNKIPAVNFFGGVPFGPSMIEFTAWMRYGGGQELKDAIYAKQGLKALDCMLFASESGGWFKNTIRELRI